LRLRAAGANNQPRARNDHAYRSVALGTKHSVVVRRPSNVYEPVRSSDEYWASWTKYWVLRTTRFGRSVESDRMGLRPEDMNPSSNHGRLVIRRLGVVVRGTSASYGELGPLAPYRRLRPPEAVSGAL